MNKEERTLSLRGLFNKVCSLFQMLRLHAKNTKCKHTVEREQVQQGSVFVGERPSAFSEL
jgi:hypothetical protein